MSAFALEDGVVYHTYSAYARGLDGLWGMYQWLDRAPNGRNETGPWWRRRDGIRPRRRRARPLDLPSGLSSRWPDTNRLPRELADSGGLMRRASDKYHGTITRAWLHFVAVHVQRWGSDSFAGFLERNPRLLDRALIEHFYSPELIRSHDARATWTEPDLRRLPALV